MWGRGRVGPARHEVGRGECSGGSGGGTREGVGMEEGKRKAGKYEENCTAVVWWHGAAALCGTSCSAPVVKRSCAFLLRVARAHVM